MATPSSSTTTPSPRPMFLQAAVVVPPAAVASKEDPSNDEEERQKAVQKFLASAELSQLARGLRTRLAYASFKATHNLTHNTLPDLEAQASSHATSAKVPAAKVPNNHYSNPATQGSGAMVATTSARSPRKGAMAPPPMTASATQSLYASLLQPPPSKRARTIHNPQDPPLPSSPKPRPTTPPRKPTKSSRTVSHSAPSKLKGRKEDKGKRKETQSRPTPSKSRTKPRRTLDSEGFADEDVDMKAAATLTSLLHSRPSKSVTASSPRSSMSAGSDGGSTHSYSQYAQSSTRSTAPTSLVPSTELNAPAGFPRASTPPRHVRTQSLPHVGSLGMNGRTTPKAQTKPSGGRLAGSTTPVPPSDSEAADLMLFLATSPSPVRPATSREAKDPTLLRSLSGSTALRGRVLFGQGSEDKRASSPRPLRREATGSFNSVATELTSETAVSSSQERITGAPTTSSLLNPNHNRAGGSSGSMQDAISAPASAVPAPLERTATELPPEPSSPTPAFRPRHPEAFERPRSLPALGELRGAPPTPGNSSFNLSEFINVSPSPAGAGPGKSTNLRADVGRRLFEEHHAGGSQTTRGDEPVPGGGLGAGIDLVKSPV